MLEKIKKFGGNWSSSSREKKKNLYYFVTWKKNESALPMDDLLKSVEIC